MNLLDIPNDIFINYFDCLEKILLIKTTKKFNYLKKYATKKEYIKNKKVYIINKFSHISNDQIMEKYFNYHFEERCNILNIKIHIVINPFHHVSYIHLYKKNRLVKYKQIYNSTSMKKKDLINYFNILLDSFYI
jgi:predicted AAA+ superfamily ATPase